MSYLRIEDHGIIGNLHTVALVGIDGTIDWCCLPAFDSPSVFAAILDDEIGGRFSITAKSRVNFKQQYLPESAILVTRSYCDHGLGQIVDFMPVLDEKNGSHQIIRQVSCVRGEVLYDLCCQPAFDYARARHEVHLLEGGAIFEDANGRSYGLQSTIGLEVDGSATCASFRLKEGECCHFVFKHLDDGQDLAPMIDTEKLFLRTLQYWQEWMGRCSYTERWGELLRRSVLTLKLLTYQPTGAIVAAPTMGLPEYIGGRRNWDYRYTWIRDAAFSLYGLMRMGYTAEATNFMQWLSDRTREIDVDASVPLQLMYGINGQHELKELELDHLKGYMNSRPVRVGNAAYTQLQLDIYGELMDSIYLHNKYASPISHDLWQYCRRIADWVSQNWDQPDEGIWETRGGRHNVVYSRLMCWVALDRTIRMSLFYSLPGDRLLWGDVRDRIYDQIMDKGWNPQRQAFRQHYDTDALDAANLLMPLVKFISPTDPRMLSTIDATLESLTTDSLVYRYDPKEAPDGLAGNEGTFCLCTFWLVECLTRAGRLHEARLLFEKMLGYANHLGLYAEEIGNHGGALGNFPQAFTHLSLISAGYNLNRALNNSGTGAARSGRRTGAEGS